jgi:hypothetical protein
MEVTDEMAQYMFWRLWPTGRVPLCPDTGLPNKLVEDRFYDLFLAMWDARHSWEDVSEEDVSEEDKGRFRRFLLTDEVIHRETADLYISVSVAVCSLLPFCRLEWDTLKCVIIFLSQHDRLSQPWGVKILKGVKRRLSLPVVQEWHVAAAA